MALTYTWWRDGARVVGADAATYELADADVGHEIIGKVTMSKPRYEPIARRFSFGRTTTPSSVVLKAKGRKGKAAVRVLVSAPGAVPSGPVTITSGKARTTTSLEDGRARVVLRDLRPGTRKVKVLYAGSEIVLRGRALAEVAVKKPRKRG